MDLYEALKLDKANMEIEIKQHKDRIERTRKAILKVREAMDVAKISVSCQSCSQLPKKAGYTCSPCLHFFCEDCKEVCKERCLECKGYVDKIFENKHVEDLYAKYVIIAEAIEGVY